MMAFALEDFWTLTPMYDPNWLRLYAVRVTLQDGIWAEKYYPMQPCSDAEFSKFYDYENKLTKMMVEEFREANQLFCVDLKSISPDFYGSYIHDKNAAHLSVMLLPCASRVEIYDGSFRGAEEECIWDK